MALIIVISIAAAVCSVVSIIGCLNCFFRKRQTFSNFSSPSSVNDTSTAQNNPSFTVDIEETSADVVNIEPLPDIVSKNATVTVSRPKIKCLARGSQNAFASLSTGQRSFPRDHLTYLNEVGSGWFGQAIESEALKIIGGSLKTHVVVKMLKDDASKTEQKQFMDETMPFRCLEHSNVMSLLGQCTETTPYLVILEYAANGNLKTYLMTHKVHLDTLIKRDALMKFALDAGAGLACLHRHDFVHCDISARNCLVMGDLTVKIGDYGVGETLFKEDYYVSGGELLPIRWMAPETLTQTDAVWMAQSYDKSSDMWSFGILLWEIFSMGEQPYEMYSDEAVLQGVVLDRLVAPTEISPRIPHNEKLSQLMPSLWQEPAQRLSIEDTHQYLEQLSTEKPTRVSMILPDGSDFDEKWDRFGLKDDRSYSVASEADSKIGLAGSISSENFPLDKHRSSSTDEVLQYAEGKLTIEQDEDLEISAVPKDPGMEVHSEIRKMSVEDETGEEITSPDFPSSLRVSGQEMTTSTPIASRNNINLVTDSPAINEMNADSVNHLNEPESLASGGLEFTELVSSEPVEPSSEPVDNLVHSEIENAPKNTKDVQHLDSTGFDFTEFVSSESMIDSGPEAMMKINNKEKTDQTVSRNEAQPFTEFESSKSLIGSGPEPLKPMDCKENTDQSVSHNKAQPFDIPKDSDIAIEGTIPCPDGTKLTEDHTDEDKTSSRADEPVPNDETADGDFVSNDQNKILTLNGEDFGDKNETSFFSLSSDSINFSTSALVSTVSDGAAFSVLDPLPSSPPKQTVDNQTSNTQSTSSNDNTQALLDSPSNLDLLSGQNSGSAIETLSQSHSGNAQHCAAPAVSTTESDVFGMFPSLPSGSMDFDGSSAPNPPTGDLLAALTNNDLNSPLSSHTDIPSPAKVLEEAEKDLKEALDTSSEPFSSIEFLDVKANVSADSSKHFEEPQEPGLVSNKVGTPSYSDACDDPNHHDTGVDSGSPTDGTTNLVFLSSDGSSDMHNSRRTVEISAEELGKLFLESSKLKISPTSEHGPALYRSSHIDLTGSKEGSDSMENGDEDFIDSFSAFRGLPAAPSASPVDSDGEESTETSSTSGSAKEYSCVSPLDTGQPPPALPPDIDQDKENYDPDSPSKSSLTFDSEFTEENLKNISEFYLSKGTKSPRVFEIPPLETIPEHQPVHFTSYDRKYPSSSLSDSSSVEVKYEDLFGCDSYEWDDFYGDPIVSEMNDSESHVQYRHLSNPNMADWSLSFDSDSHPSLTNVQSSIVTKSAASTSVCSANEKTGLDDQGAPSLSYSELSEQKSLEYSPKSSVVIGALAKQPKLSTLTNISVLSSDKNNSFYSLSEDYEAHLGSPLDCSQSPPAPGLDDSSKCSSSASSPSPSYPSSPSMALPTGHVISAGLNDGFGSDPVSTRNTQDANETSGTADSTFDLLGLDLTSPALSVSGLESASGNPAKEAAEPNITGALEEDSTPSLI